MAVDVVVMLVVLLPRLTRGCLFPKLDVEMRGVFETYFYYFEIMMS